MNNYTIPFAPDRASSFAPEIDHLFLFEMAVAIFFSALIFGCLIFFAIRYRRRSDKDIPPNLPSHYGLEIAWTVIPFILMLIMFFWGADVYVQAKRPIDNAPIVHIIGKQWMWKVEYENGTREINSLHLPVGQPVKLVLISQDVIHDFFVPAFRMKQDILPGSYVTEWCVPTRVGQYHFFCSQYCGTDHARMIGTVTVMEPADYQAWLASALPAEPPASAGAKLFKSYGCITCHGQRAPTLAGLYNSRVLLQDGTTVIADDNYLRRVITDPSAELVAGYPAVMPSFASLSEDQIEELIAYIKSLEPVVNLPPTSAPAGTLPPPLNAPATRPAPDGQSTKISDFPPAEAPSPIPTPNSNGSP